MPLLGINTGRGKLVAMGAGSGAGLMGSGTAGGRSEPAGGDPLEGLSEEELLL